MCGSIYSTLPVVTSSLCKQCMHDETGHVFFPVCNHGPLGTGCTSSLLLIQLLARHHTGLTTSYQQVKTDCINSKKNNSFKLDNHNGVHKEPSIILNKSSQLELSPVTARPRIINRQDVLCTSCSVRVCVCVCVCVCVSWIKCPVLSACSTSFHLYIYTVLAVTDINKCKVHLGHFVPD